MGSNAALQEFVGECEELSERVSANLRLIESNRQNGETFNAVYRDLHTIKGSARLFGFLQTGHLAHVMESVLDPFRKNKSEINTSVIDALYKCLDVIDNILTGIRTKSREPDVKSTLNVVIPNLIESTINRLECSYKTTNDVQLMREDLQREKKQIEDLINEIGLGSQEESSSSTLEPFQGSQSSVEKTSGTKVEKHMEAAKSNESSESSSPLEGDSQSTVRVQVSILDKLMNLAGEMVLVRNQVLQYSNDVDNIEFTKLSQRLDLVTSELQGEVMQTRMQPIGNVLNKFHRVVRDFSADLKKKIDLELVGTETELDKTLLEAVKDPLTHLVRNACDHGIELPEERVASGKSETGTIIVRSFHEGGQVIIEISDDGRGLDRDKLLRKGIDNGLVPPDRVQAMSDSEIYDLIFAPGFSTATQVTEVSGRGVGMDVVKTNIEAIGGAIELQSHKGQGSVIKLKIPLTLAIVPAMVIKCGDDRFAIPQVKLVELVRVEKSELDNSRNQIEFLQGQPVFRLRGNLLPLVVLRGLLGFKGGTPEHLKEMEEVNIVVLNVEGEQFGLVVDEIHDTTDIVVKPLSKFLKGLTTYSGATIMGDGSVALILDVTGLAQSIQMFGEKSRHLDKHTAGLDEKSAAIDVQEFLFFKILGKAKYAIPLCLVNRLEEFDSGLIEFSGDQRVIRYRDAILPLISLNQQLLFTTDDVEIPETIQVVVVRKFDKNFGIEVGEILDVVAVKAEIDDTLRDREGVLGNMIVGDEVIVVVDVLNIIDKEARRMGQKNLGFSVDKKPDGESSEGRQRSLRILLVEDTDFFRKHIGKGLEGSGVRVEYDVDGAKALERLQNSKRSTFDVILSDIEMPNMDGFELAEEIRRDEVWKDVPLIAITTKFNQRDITRGKSVGYDLYLEKFNLEELLSSIDGLTEGKNK